MTIRKVKAEDAASLLNIYGYYVEHSAVTFEIERPTVEEFRRRIEEFSASFPYFVAERDGKIVGYCYAHTLRERAAFNHCVEVSIYIAHEERRTGAGRELYAALEAELLKRGKRNLYASVTWIEQEDEYLSHDSKRFHERMGYREVGHLHECGYKFNRWYDMLWMEKIMHNA